MVCDLVVDPHSHGRASSFIFDKKLYSARPSGHLYPALNVLFYEETDFVHGHYQSIRPAPIVQPQQHQSPTVTQQYRSQLPSVDSIGEPNLQSTNVNCDATCDTSNQNSTRTRNSRESSYLPTVPPHWTLRGLLLGRG